MPQRTSRVHCYFADGPKPSIPLKVGDIRLALMDRRLPWGLDMVTATTSGSSVPWRNPDGRDRTRAPCLHHRLHGRRAIREIVESQRGLEDPLPSRARSRLVSAAGRPTFRARTRRRAIAAGL